MSNDAYRIDWKAGWIHYRSFFAVGIQAAASNGGRRAEEQFDSKWERWEQRRRRDGGGEMGRSSWLEAVRRREREREKGRERKEQPSWKFYRRRPRLPCRGCWMPCHPVISPYQPRNCPETSTGLSDDAQLLSSFRSSNYSIDQGGGEESFRNSNGGPLVRFARLRVIIWAHASNEEETSRVTSDPWLPAIGPELREQSYDDDRVSIKSFRPRRYVEPRVSKLSNCSDGGEEKVESSGSRSRTLRWVTLNASKTRAPPLFAIFQRTIAHCLARRMFLGRLDEA